MNGFVRGALAGTAATGVMSAFMESAKHAGALDREPPEIITGNLEDKADTPVIPGAPFRARWITMHTAFGAGAGGAFGAMRAALPRNTAAAGALFGAAVWAAMYPAVLPLSGLYPAPADDWQPRARTIALAHLVYGVALATAFDRSAPRRT